MRKKLAPVALSTARVERRMTSVAAAVKASLGVEVSESTKSSDFESTPPVAWVMADGIGVQTMEKVAVASLKSGMPSESSGRAFSISSYAFSSDAGVAGCAAAPACSAAIAVGGVTVDGGGPAAGPVDGGGGFGNIEDMAGGKVGVVGA